MIPFSLGWFFAMGIVHPALSAWIQVRVSECFVIIEENLGHVSWSKTIFLCTFPRVWHQSQCIILWVRPSHLNRPKSSSMIVLYTTFWKALISAALFRPCWKCLEAYVNSATLDELKHIRSCLKRPFARTSCIHGVHTKNTQIGIHKGGMCDKKRRPSHILLIIHANVLQQCNPDIILFIKINFLNILLLTVVVGAAAVGHV